MFDIKQITRFCALSGLSVTLMRSTITVHFSFNDRYLHVVATANKVLSFVLRFSKQSKDPCALLKLYASHWCCSAWNMSRLSGSSKVVNKFCNLLERVQHRSLRTLAYDIGCSVANDRHRSCLISQL